MEESLRTVPNLEMRKVDYLKVRELEAFRAYDAGRLPYVKREGFSDEREWRIVLTCQEEAVMARPIRINVQSLRRILLNPWMPASLADNLRNIIRKIPGCESLKIEASRLTNSDRWKSAGRSVVNLV